MKTFSTSGTGSGQTLTEIESDKIPVYNDLDAVTADLANLSDGQIGTTKDTGSELSAPVDTVQSGNMHAVTSNAVVESLSYSTTEQATGAKWIDGKPIYRKVLSTGQLPNTTTIQPLHGITNLDKITNIRGVAYRADGVQIPIPFQSGTTFVVANIYGNYLQVTSNADYSGYAESYIIIEYTKTA